MFAGLDENDYRAVCIGINSTAPTASATSAPTTVTTTKVSATMGPTQTGVVAGCSQFYTVKSGDSCAAIEGMFAISFADLYKWNPSIGSDCENLWLGYAYCVGAPSASTPAAPTQSGLATNCNKYYTVGNGDGCDTIESLFDVTFQQLYQWNPAIGSNCTNLWLGYAVCVGVSS